VWKSAGMKELHIGNRSWERTTQQTWLVMGTDPDSVGTDWARSRVHREMRREVPIPGLRGEAIREDRELANGDVSGGK